MNKIIQIKPCAICKREPFFIEKLEGYRGSTCLTYLGCIIEASPYVGYPIHENIVEICDEESLDELFTEWNELQEKIENES